MWGISLRRRRLPNWIRRRANKALEKALESFPSPIDQPAKKKPVAKPRRGSPVRLVWWALTMLGRFLSKFTRVLEFRLGGVDPALLGILTGILGGAAMATGLRLRWIPMFQPGPFRFRLRWTISVSLLGIFIGVGKAASMFPRKPGRSGLLPSAS